jgi:hypothetical protein
MNIIHMDLRLNEGGMGRTGKKDGSDAVKAWPGSEKLLEGTGRAWEGEMAQVALEVEGELRLGFERRISARIAVLPSPRDKRGPQIGSVKPSTF